MHTPRPDTLHLAFCNVLRRTELGKCLCSGQPRSSCLRNGTQGHSFQPKHQGWMDQRCPSSQVNLMLPRSRSAQSSWEQQVCKGVSKAITVSIGSSDTSLEHQSFPRHHPTAGVLQSAPGTLRKSLMERHDKTHNLGSRIQTLRRNRTYVAKATSVFLLSAYAL